MGDFIERQTEGLYEVLIEKLKLKLMIAEKELTEKAK